MWKTIIDEIEKFPGKTGFYFKNMTSAEEFGYNCDEQFRAASVIKLPLLAAMLYERENGNTDFSEIIHISAGEKVPGCGAVQHMKNTDIDIETLAKLMIVISDNTATNALARHYSIPLLQTILKKLGFDGTQLNRCLYDTEKELLGVQNYIVLKEIGKLLENIYLGKFINKKISKYLESILLDQQICHKIPSMLPYDTDVAHKTGEEEGTSHDVAIVYGKNPFILCFASNETDVPAFEQFMRKTAVFVYEYCNK